MKQGHLVYGYDALCGWCYGAIPAVRHLKEAFPNLEIEVLPGGLVTGERIRPYSGLLDYIHGAADNLERVTGRRPSSEFFQMISQDAPPVASSLQPSDAVRQVKDTAPDHALEFAHLLQEAHFEAGQDLNDPKVYHDISDRLGLPRVQTDEWHDQSAIEARLAPMFERARDLGISSFPSYVLVGPTPVHIDTCYDPQQLADAVLSATS